MVGGLLYLLIPNLEGFSKQLWGMAKGLQWEGGLEKTSSM